MRRVLIYLLFVFINVSVFGQSKVYKIGYLLDKTFPETEAILAELSNEISAVVGEDAVIQFPESQQLVNNFDEQQAAQNYERLLSTDIDIIIAFGVVNNAVISKLGQYQKPTIVFGNLSQELIDQKGIPTDVKNFVAITTSQSFTKDLRLLQQLANPKIVGVALERPFLENLPIKTTFDSISRVLDLNFELIPFESLNDITTNLEGIDALYLAGGFYLTDNQTQKLAQVLIEKKLPSFTANLLDDVSQGILAGNHSQSELSQFFRRVALTVESIVLNNEFSHVNTVFETKSNLVVNYNTARKIGLPLKYSLVASTTFVGDPNEIVANKTYSLALVMQEVITQNLNLQVLQRDIALADKDVKLANSDYLPNVIANASGAYIDPKLAAVSNGQNPEMRTSGNIALQQTVFSEAANANISIQKSLREAQKENYNSETLNTVFNAATAYFTALVLKANLSIQSQNLELTRNNLKIATENYEAGQSGKSDVLRFKSALAQNSQQTIEAVNQLEQGYYALNQLLNNPIDTKIDVEDAQLERDVFSNYNYEQLGQFLDDSNLRTLFVAFLVQEAINNAPELRALDYNMAAAERSERLFGIGRFLPTVALQGQYNYEFSRSGVGSNFTNGFMDFPEDNYTVGLNVSVPVFNQNRQNLNKQIAAVQKEQLGLSKDNTLLTIEKNLNDIVLDLINQISNIKLSQVFEESAKEALDLTQTSYASGAVNIVQLLDAQNNYIQAQFASTTATYNYLRSALALERALGVFFLLEDTTERQAFIQRFLEFTQKSD